MFAVRVSAFPLSPEHTGMVGWFFVLKADASLLDMQHKMMNQMHLIWGLDVSAPLV